MLHFDCPACKAKCEAAASTVGMTIACPHCGKPAVVPNQTTATASGAIVFRNVVLVLVGLALVGFVVMLVIPENQGGKGGSGGTNPVVVMETSMGTVKIELFADKAPITVKNFLEYVDDKHYDGTIFHRVMPDFMIQGGGFMPGMRQKKQRESIKNESNNGVSNLEGTLAMARTNHPDSATDQFFINVANNSRLDRSAGNAGYAVFGKVISGMDVVDRIRKVPARDLPPELGGHEKVPLQDVMIISIRRLDSK
jgi:cyclophilin family peptidyl-prolyl cis-trans isomerase